MKNEKDQKDGRSPSSHIPPGKHQKTDPKTTEGGRGTNQNDDPSEDSKGGGNFGRGDQEGANQGHHQGRKH